FGHRRVDVRRARPLDQILDATCMVESLEIVSLVEDGVALRFERSQEAFHRQSCGIHCQREVALASVQLLRLNDPFPCRLKIMFGAEGLHGRYSSSPATFGLASSSSTMRALSPAAA